MSVVGRIGTGQEEALCQSGPPRFSVGFGDAKVIVPLRVETLDLERIPIRGHAGNLRERARACVRQLA